MHPLSGRRVTKMNGLGNEIAILDLRDGGLAVTEADARAIGRHPGLRFDQLMVLAEPRSSTADAFMTIYNRDGSRAGACGNGTRCVAWLLLRDTAREELILETAAARLTCRRAGEFVVSVEMGRPRLGWREIPLRAPVEDTRRVPIEPNPPGSTLLGPAAVVDMGNPHAIFFVSDFAAHDLATIGPSLETHPLFPERANISLARIVSPEHIALKVWERGTGLTRACGSAACAALVAAARNDLTGRRAKVSLPGGDLEIDWRPDDIVVMTGPVEFEFETRLESSRLTDSAA